MKKIKQFVLFQMYRIEQFVLDIFDREQTPVQYDTELTQTYSDYGRGQR